MREKGAAGAAAREDPIALFEAWHAEAVAAGLRQPQAVALATVGAEGQPSLRMVLLKAVDGRGFVFYTNVASRKGRELADNARAALCFYWPETNRQVRVEGAVAPVDAAEADAYFSSRERTSQIGAWASRQSEVLGGRFDLERRIAKYTARFGLARVPRPAFWSGYRVVPARIEFWRQGQFRLHERKVFTATETGWSIEWLYP